MPTYGIDRLARLGAAFAAFARAFAFAFAFPFDSSFEAEAGFELFKLSS